METSNPSPASSAAPPERRRSWLAIASLCLGIFSLLCGSYITAIPAIILGGVGIWHFQRMPQLASRLSAVAGLICGLIGFFNFLLLMGSQAEHYRKANIRFCNHNVRSITAAAIEYSREHDGVLPKNLDDLGPRLKPWYIYCSGQKDVPSYRIEHCGEKTSDLRPAETIIVTEIKSPHRGMRSVGFLDGHVEMVQPAVLNPNAAK